MPTVKPSKTLVTFLLDRTGSMGSIKAQTIESFNAYLSGLKGDKKVKVDFTLLQFDSVSLDKTCVAVPVAEAPELNDQNYQPRAGTPLIDSAYKTIKAVEESVGGSNAKVVICIQTDGEENASREYSWDQLNDLIKEKIKLGWQFNFMGASMDAYKQASRMGISTANTMSYDGHNLKASKAAFMGRASATMSFASGATADMAVSSLEKRAAGDKFDPALHATAPLAHPNAARVTIGPTFIKPNTVAKKAIVDDFKL